MKYFMAFLLTLLFSTNLFAGVRAFNATTDLKNFDTITCSTGLSCSRVLGRLVMVSSPTVSAAAFTIAGAEAGNAVMTLAADESDDSGDDWAITSAASGNALNFSNDSTGSLVSRMSLSILGELSGVRSPVVTATATTITTAQCGSTFINSGAVQMELFEASLAVGCTLTFVTANASNFDVNPDDADQILVQTNAAGDAMRNATLGNSITLRAINASQWTAISVSGTYTDIN